MTTTITKLKAQLGLNFPKKSSGAGPQVITELLTGFTEINKQYTGLKPPQVHASEHVRKEASELFEKLGPSLWPDPDTQAGLPSWLSYPSGDSDKQHLSRRYYSNITDRNFLADRFYDLVCLKLNHRNKNRVKRKTNPRLESEDLSDSEEAKRSGYRLQNDVPVPQNVAEDRQNNFVYPPAPGISSAPSEDIRPLSIDQESKQPIAVSPAPYLNGHNPMGDTSSKLIAGELEFPNIKLKEHMVKQQKRANRTNSHQLDINSAGLQTLIFQARMESASDSQSPPRFIGQNGRSPIPTTHNTKRLLPDGTCSRKIKRSKKDSEVQTVKPSLIVVRKLTRGKGVSNRQITVPPQQLYVPMPFVEDDEISVRHPSVPASQHDVAASGPDIGDERTSIQPVEPMNDISEVAMDNPHDLNDLTSATDPTDATRPLNTMPDRPHATQTQGESQVIADFYRLWSGEASELVRAMLTTSPSKHTPRNLLSDIILPVLRDTYDQLPSRTSQDDSLSTSSDGQNQFTPRALNFDQQPGASVEHNVSASDTAHHMELAEVPILAFENGNSFESTVETTSRTKTTGKHMNNGCSNSLATAESRGETYADLRNGIITDGQLSKTTPDNTCPTNMPGVAASKVSGSTTSTDSRYDHGQLVQHINLTLLLDREDGSHPVYITTIGIENIRNNSDLFDAIEQRSWWRVKPEEEVFRAIITEAGGSARTATDRPRIELGSFKGDTDDRSWNLWLVSLRKFYERERVDTKMDLVARVFVTRRSDWKG